jgi:hypothetical protein
MLSPGPKDATQIQSKKNSVLKNVLLEDDHWTPFAYSISINGNHHQCALDPFIVPERQKHSNGRCSSFLVKPCGDTE